MKKIYFDDIYSEEDPWKIKKSIFERIRGKKIAKMMKHYLPFNSVFINCLDIGGGEGTISWLIMKNLNKSIKLYALINLDVSQRALKRSKALNIYDSVIEADGMQLPFKDETFDLVFALEVLYYMSNYDQCLKEIYRVLKHSGYLICSVALGKSYLDWNRILKDVKFYFKVIASEVLRYPFWILKREHYGKGIILAKKV
jgi:ubiquinone/menaquinone biosynthesis C-methylase UbiE